MSPKGGSVSPGKNGAPATSMANDEHLGVLLQGQQQWNDSRDANPEVKPDLRNADLHEADLSGVNLSHAVLIGADLHKASLRGANLAGANLRRADLRATNFRNADLHRAILAKTDLRDANLKEADIREADMRGARLPGADFGGADLKGAVLNKDGFRYVSTHNDQLQTTAAGSSSPPAANKTLEPAAAKGPRLKLALAAGGLLLAVGIVGLSVSRPTREVDARVTAAVAEAVGASGGVFAVEVEGQALILRSGSKKVESGRYLGLLKTACQALDKMGPESGLREIRITNQSGEEGWVYEAPEQCGEILTKPPALTSLSIAAHTKPIRKRGPGCGETLPVVATVWLRQSEPRARLLPARAWPPAAIRETRSWALGLSVMARGGRRSPVPPLPRVPLCCAPYQFGNCSVGMP